MTKPTQYIVFCQHPNGMSEFYVVSTKTAKDAVKFISGFFKELRVTDVREFSKSYVQ